LKLVAGVVTSSLTLFSAGIESSGDVGVRRRAFRSPRCHPPRTARHRGARRARSTRRSLGDAPRLLLRSSTARGVRTARAALPRLRPRHPGLRRARAQRQPLGSRPAPGRKGDRADIRGSGSAIRRARRRAPSSGENALRGGRRDGRHHRPF
jgi:hypothetical protein